MSDNLPKQTHKFRWFYFTKKRKWKWFFRDIKKSFINNFYVKSGCGCEKEGAYCNSRQGCWYANYSESGGY